MTKIKELAEKIEKAVVNRDLLREQRKFWFSKQLWQMPDHSYRTNQECFDDWIVKRFQIIAQAAGGIRELCEQAETNKKAFEEAIKQRKSEVPSGRIYRTKSQEVQNG